MIKGIFFDLYGTLFKYENMSQAWGDWLDTLYENFKIYDKDLTKESLSKSCEGFFGKEEPEYDSPKLSIFEKRIKMLSEELVYEIPDSAIIKTAQDNLTAWQKHIYLDEQTIPLLKILQKEYTLGIITNFDHPPHVKNVIKENSIINFFEKIIISGDVGCKKPDKKIFEKALENTGLKPSEVLFVGDSNDDIIGAESAGLIPVFINRELKSEEMLDFNKIEDKEKLNLNNDLILITELKEIINIINKK